MRKRFLLIAVLAFTYGFRLAPKALSQQSAPDSGRRVIHRVEPQYPMPARRMHLGGTVKLTAVVAADGSVKKVEPLGGSPILVEAAQTALSRWKFAPGGESRESVEIQFTP